uniref:Uncharacterized protein n=1 Tax=Vespula pensylvanica TaxID=30213 RepID=A0A834KUA4_VESPE|nr:hypothetical protein H0235_012919 [Vespula pensylvanica]
MNINQSMIYEVVIVVVLIVVVVVVHKEETFLISKRLNAIINDEAIRSQWRVKTTPTASWKKIEECEKVVVGNGGGSGSSSDGAWWWLTIFRLLYSQIDFTLLPTTKPKDEAFRIKLPLETV